MLLLSESALGYSKSQLLWFLEGFTKMSFISSIFYSVRKKTKGEFFR